LKSAKFLLKKHSMHKVCTEAQTDTKEQRVQRKKNNRAQNQYKPQANSKKNKQYKRKQKINNPLLDKPPAPKSTQKEEEAETSIYHPTISTTWFSHHPAALSNSPLRFRK
jgi:hypothetical protein